MIRTETEYLRCLRALLLPGIVHSLPDSGSSGYVGVDGREYLLPTLEEIRELIENNRDLVRMKSEQGFTRLIITPMAVPLGRLLLLHREFILRVSASGEIFQTRRNPGDPGIPARINPDRLIWPWIQLERRFDTEEIIYFPESYSAEHRGRNKFWLAGDTAVCGLPGWSVSLAEPGPFLPLPGCGEEMGGRKQPETGCSPKEYLEMLRSDTYRGETGYTIEDALIDFISRLAEAREVSRDRNDGNGLWLLGQYVRGEYAEMVPTAWWCRPFGRLRLDMHRTGNKKCAASHGLATLVRLPAISG